MAFPLKNLELHVDDYLLPIGEKCYEDGQVNDLREVDKNLWVAEVNGYEVEVQITPSKVAGMTCECSRYHETGSCEHVIATMLAVRKTVADKKSERHKSRKVKASPTKFTVGVLLQQVSSDDLSAFVREYARTHRDFSIALKARFASDVTLLDDKEKYLQLLETTLSAARKRNRMISHRSAGSVLKVLDELLVQSGDAMAQQYYTDVLLIASAIIEKISPVLNKLERPSNALRTRINDAFGLIHTIISSDPAPSLLQQLWEYLLQECGRLQYWVADVSAQFFELLTAQATTAQRQTALLQRLDELLADTTKFGDYRTELVLVKLSIYECAGATDKAQQLIEANLNEPDVLQLAIEQALASANYKRAKYLATEGLKAMKGLHVRHFFEDALLQVAIVEGDTDDILHYGKQRFLVSLDLKYYQQLRQTNADNWAVYRQELMGLLLKMPYSIRKRDIVANIYALEKDYDTLLEYIISIRSLDLLQRYDEQLLDTHQSQVYQCYEDFLKSYLRHHLGRQTSQKVRQTIQHLFGIGARDLATRLVREFRTTYRERHTLMEELVMF
ncbi:MAG: hypothetical protein AAGK47_07015 [Bacteroidota bacterium]